MRKNLFIKKLLYTLIALQFTASCYSSSSFAANDFIVSGDNETQTTIAGNKAYGQDYFVKQTADGSFVPDTGWQHDGAIIMAKGLSKSGYHDIFKKVNGGWILPSYININDMPDNWAPTFISVLSQKQTYIPGKEGYDELAQDLREAINAAPGSTLAEKLAAFYKSNKIPDSFKNKGMIMIQIEQGDDSAACYSQLREGKTAIEPNYGTVQIGRLGVWRPMDWGDTIYYEDESCKDDANLCKIASFRIMPNGKITMAYNFKDKQTAQPDRVQQVNDALLYVNKLEMQPGAKVDLCYANTIGDNPRVNQYSDDKIHDPQKLDSFTNNVDSRLARTMVINDAVLDENTTFRIGSYKKLLSYGNTKESEDRGERVSDTVWIKNATQKNLSSNPTKIYLELGYVPELGEKIEASIQRSEFSGQYNPIFGIMNGADKFELVAKTSHAEGLFSEYLVTPKIASNQSMQDYFSSDSGERSGRAWELAGYTFQIVGASEGGKTAGDNMIAVNNVWKNSQRNLFKRAGGLYNLGDQPKTQENVWAETYHEKFNSASDYGRSIKQSINGYQLGYDRLVADNFYKGKVYLGGFVNHNTGKSTTLTGSGDQKATGFGLYGTWKGDRGHYIDLALMRSKLSNDYELMQPFESGTEKVTGSFDTEAYGVGMQYGYRKEIKNGWYIEPQLTTYAGMVKGCDYDLVSQTKQQTLHQDDFKNITARTGFYIGKDFKDRGNIYVGAFAGHDYAKDMKISAGYKSQTINNLGQAITTDLKDTVNMPDNEDNWYELNIGGKYNIDKNTNVYANYSKTVGSSTGNSWKINGGLQLLF